ncbi:hypothetical protein [Streptomyces viridochromogenes]|nr:hypothetical protein [Streptomyces viridochromogenes]
MIVSHTAEHGVLVITVHRDPGIAERASLVAEISSLARAHRPAPVVIILEEPVTTGPAVSAVLRTHHMCNRLGVFMSVATHSAPARRMLETRADTSGSRIVIHARIDTAIDAACATNGFRLPAAQ